MVRDDALQAIRAEWIDVGDGRYSLEAYANAWDAEAVVGVSVYAKAVVESDPSLEDGGMGERRRAQFRRARIR